MELMIKLMKVENEENALLCIKILIDGFRNHKVSTNTVPNAFTTLTVRSKPNPTSNHS